MKRIYLLAGGIALSLCAALPAAADVLYSQAADPAAGGAWTSQTSNGNSGALQAFDNFKLSATGTATIVSWTGWSNPYDLIAPAFGTQINSFTINFYKNNYDAGTDTNSVGDLIVSNTITGNANQSYLGASTGGFGIFDFSATVQPFIADMDTTYWISIVADPDLINNGDWKWAFAPSNVGDGQFYDYDGSNLTLHSPADFAFTLSNVNAVPEPSSLVFLGTGALAIVGAARRRLGVA